MAYAQWLVAASWGQFREASYDRKALAVDANGRVVMVRDTMRELLAETGDHPGLTYIGLPRVAEPPAPTPEEVERYEAHKAAALALATPQGPPPETGALSPGQLAQLQAEANEAEANAPAPPAGFLTATEAPLPPAPVRNPELKAQLAQLQQQLAKDDGRLTAASIAPPVAVVTGATTGLPVATIQPGAIPQAPPPTAPAGVQGAMVTEADLPSPSADEIRAQIAALAAKLPPASPVPGEGSGS